MGDIFDIFKKIESAKEKKNGEIEYVVACLGNPGKQYENTRHNAGFMTLAYITEKYGFDVKRAKFSSLCNDAVIAGKRCLFLMPQTFMNESGIAVKQALDFYKLGAENLIVVFDDISLDVGRMRIRKKGSAGGHNGIKSIIAHIGSENFPRIKIGVGQKPSPDYDLVSWVLGKFDESDRKNVLPPVFEKAACALELMVNGKFDEAENLYNGK